MSDVCCGWCGEENDSELGYCTECGRKLCMTLYDDTEEIPLEATCPGRQHHLIGDECTVCGYPGLKSLEEE